MAGISVVGHGKIFFLESVVFVAHSTMWIREITGD